MSYNLLWIFFLILQTFTASLPIPDQYDLGVIGIDRESKNFPKIQSHEDSPDSSGEKVISVRITSSVAVGRGRGKSTHLQSSDMVDELNTPSTTSTSEAQSTTINPRNEEVTLTGNTDVPSSLVGANTEYIKQLNAKKEYREHSADLVHPFHLTVKSQNDDVDESFQRESTTKIDEYIDYTPDIPLARKVPSSADANRFQEQKSIRRYQNTDNKPLTEVNDEKDSRDINMLRSTNTFVSNSNHFQADDSVAESSIKSVEFAKYNEGVKNSPLTATMPPVHSRNDIQGLKNRPLNEGRNSPRLTTVSFNIVHDTPEVTNDNEPSHSFISSSQIVPNQKQFYEPPKIYSQPAQIYSEPAKFYSEPAKIYSEPAKIYSEPAKVYSEPAKIYSEPAKFYSEPASLHLNQNLPSSIAPNYSTWQRQPQHPIVSTTINTTPTITIVTSTFQRDSNMDHQPEKNYEVDEKISVLTDGRSHGIQPETSTEKCKQDNCKVGYVVEGRQFKKYRVEERTPDGFIVGEYGVVRNEDGALRGVRYTADGEASPRLIHDALMKFLQLK